MIKLEGVSKQYKGQTVVDNVTLAIPDGSTFGFLGVNGAGKTTTMKMIVGLLKPDGGHISIDGNPVDVSGKEAIGFMPEGPYFYENLTGLELLKFYGGFFSSVASKAENYFIKVLTQVNLGDAGNKRIRTYSKGMRQRLGFAQALINNPSYVFLDEPLDGLDPIGRREIKKIVKDMHAAGKTIFLNSHILSDIEEICDQIGVIHRGRLVYKGTVDSFCAGIPLEERFVELVSSK